MGKMVMDRRSVTTTTALHKILRAYIVAMPLFSVALIAIWRNMAIDNESSLLRPLETSSSSSTSSIVVAKTKPVEDLAGGSSVYTGKPSSTTEEETGKNVQSKKHQRRIPNILIAGAQKASTTSIARYLRHWLGACFSEPNGKEAHFFDYPRTYRSGLSVYQDRFAHCPSDARFLLDGTPDTMVYADQVKKIYDEHGSTDALKVIFILREPVAREISRYNHQRRLAMSPNNTTHSGWGKHLVAKSDNGTTVIKSFLEDAQTQIVRPIQSQSLHQQKSCYAHHLRRWFDLFDRRRQVLVLSYDELTSHPASFLRRLHVFLDVPVPTDDSALTVPRHNTAAAESSIVSSYAPPCVDQWALAKLFEPLNEDLYRLLQDHPGPAMEQRPFPRFAPPQCNNNTTT
jgi:hypothetical protein